MRHGTEAGLGAFAVNTSDRFSAIGDVARTLRRETLDACESLAKSFETHFRQKGFDVSPPRQHLNLVVLSSPKAYAKFVGDDLGPSVGGHYDLDDNYLVTFDFVPASRQPSVAEAHTNTRTLAHEQPICSPSTRACSTARVTFGLHQRRPGHLCGNLGTERSGQVRSSECRLAEGFCPEPRQDPRSGPIARLLTNDGLFDKKETMNMAYAESWTMLYTLLSTEKGPPKLRRYLDLIRPRRDPANRLQDARNALGDLDELDSEISRNASRLIRRP